MPLAIALGLDDSYAERLDAATSLLPTWVTSSSTSLTRPQLMTYAAAIS